MCQMLCGRDVGRKIFRDIFVAPGDEVLSLGEITSGRSDGVPVLLSGTNDGSEVVL